MNRQSKLRPEKAYREYLRLSRREEETFLDTVTGAVRAELGQVASHCVACAKGLRDHASQGYNRCTTCGTLNSSPRLKASELTRLWSESGAASLFHQHVYAPAREKRMQLMRERLSLLAHYLQSGEVVEVGCGIGLFLDALREAGFSCQGVDVIPFCARICRQKGHVIHAHPIEELQLPLEQSDAVAAWEVLAHLSDPLGFLKNAWRWLKPGGTLILSTPNAAGLEYDQIWKDGLLHHDNLKPHIFLQIFSIEGLRALLRRTGFRVLTLSTPGKMDVQNIQQMASSEGLRYSSRFFSHLLQSQGSFAERRRASFQRWLAAHLLSGHALVVAEKHSRHRCTRTVAPQEQ